MSPQALESLLRLLHADRDQAGQRYEAIRRKLAKLFEWRGCPEPEALADETFDRVARRVEEGLELRHGDPYAYIHAVALRVAQEQWRKPARERRVLEHVARTSSPVEPEGGQQGAERDLRLECLARCVAELEAPSRSLLERYHAGEKRARIDARQALAAELGLSASALRIKAYRLRAGLLRCIEDCAERAGVKRIRTGVTGY